MWFRKILQTSKGREISYQEKEMYIRRGAVQSNGGTLCPALAELMRQMPPALCDEHIYQGLERAVKEKSGRKSPWISIFIMMAIFMIVFSTQGFFVQANEKSLLVTTYLRIMCFAAISLVWMMRYKKRTGAKQSDIRHCVERREGITAFSFYISELCWHSHDPDINTYDAYLVSENILFSVSYDMFNSARPGDYFTAVVVDTGAERIFYIVNYR